MRLRYAGSPGARLTGVLAGNAGKAGQLIWMHASRLSPDTTAGIAVALSAPGRQAQREETVLGVLLRGDPHAGDILARLSPGAFLDPVRREIFAAIADMSQRGRGIDPVTLDWELMASETPGLRPQTDTAVRLDQRDSYATRLASASPARPADDAVRELARSAPPVTARQRRPQERPARSQVVRGHMLPPGGARQGNGHAVQTGLIPPGPPPPGGRTQGR